MFTPNIHIALFADDTALYTQSWRTDTIARRLTRALSRVVHYLRRWRLKVNITKTTAIIFTKRRPPEPEPISLEGAMIPWTKKLTYLGLYFTSTLNFTEHVKRSAQKAIRHLVQLFPLLARESTFAPATKIHLYKTSIRSSMTYAAPVWCSVSQSTYQYMQVIQNKCLRVITQSPRCTPIAHLITDYIVLFEVGKKFVGVKAA